MCAGCAFPLCCSCVNSSSPVWFSMTLCCVPFPVFSWDCRRRLSFVGPLRKCRMQCKECGANLPENARYCLQCGTTVGSDPTQQPGQKLDFVQPALSGGMLLGFLSSMPIIGFFNCICCMWVLLGGGVATVLLT